MNLAQWAIIWLGLVVASHPHLLEGADTGSAATRLHGVSSTAHPAAITFVFPNAGSGVVCEPCTLRA